MGLVIVGIYLLAHGLVSVTLRTWSLAATAGQRAARFAPTQASAPIKITKAEKVSQAIAGPFCPSSSVAARYSQADRPVNGAVVGLVHSEKARRATQIAIPQQLSAASFEVMSGLPCASRAGEYFILQ